MKPDFGIATQLNIPRAVRRVVVHYQGEERTLSITNDTLSFDFRPQN